VAGPASGPKWLVLSGIDRALMSAGLLDRESTSPPGRLLLAGASAGAWRMLAMACADPAAVHAALQERYIGQSFARKVTPGEVSDAYRQMLAAVFPASQTSCLFDRDHLEVAVHLVRARGPAGSSQRLVQAAAMLAAAGLNALSARTMRLWFEPVLCATGAERFAGTFDGPVVKLTAENLQAAALATGSVPLYFVPVTAGSGWPPGRYIDGGLCDYHLNTAYNRAGDGLTLLPHFQERITPNWFDRYIQRRPQQRIVSDVLQVFPTPAFVAGLPGGRIPDRDDFKRFAGDPSERIRRWRTVVRESDRLGEQLLHDIETGRIPDIVESMAQ
jgi:hypothetical protein